MQKEDKLVKFCLINPNKPNSSSGRMNRAFAPSVNIPVIDVVWDEATKTQREIRFIPGEKSIFKDEQNTKDMPKKRSEIIFNDGWKVLQPEEKLLIAYLRATNHNQGTKKRREGTSVLFKEFKPEMDAQINLDKEEVVSKATSAVFTMPFEDLKNLAKAMGLNINRDAAEIKHDMLYRAKKDPKKFLDDMVNKNMKIRWVILEAVDERIIEINKQNCTVSWTNGGVVFQTAPGTDIIEDFAEFSKTEDGQRVFDRIKLIYDKIGSADLASLSPLEIFNKAMEANIITKVGSEHMYKGEKIGRGVNVIQARISEDDSLRKELIEKIGIFEQQLV